jgi:hypothetical protein
VHKGGCLFSGFRLMFVTIPVATMCADLAVNASAQDTQPSKVWDEDVQRMCMHGCFLALMPAHSPAV